MLACVFALADAIYGCVASVYVGESRWAIGFGSFALISLAIYVPFVRSRLTERYRELSTEGRIS